MTIERILQALSFLIGTAVIVIAGSIFFLNNGGVPIPSTTIDFVGGNATKTSHIEKSNASTTNPGDVHTDSGIIQKDEKTETSNSKTEVVTAPRVPKKTVETPGALVVPPLPPPPPPSTPKEGERIPKSTGVLNQEDIIFYTNAERATVGLPPLAFNKQLAAMAEAKAVDMIEKQYFAHVSPSGVDVSAMAETYGYAYLNVGENLALGDFMSSREVVTGWMNSPGHRANILHNNYKEIGVAALIGKYEGRTVWFAVQEFGRPLADCPMPDELLKQKIVIYQGQLDALETSLDKLKAEIETPGLSRGDYNAKVKDFNTVAALYNSLLDTTKSAIALFNGQADTYNTCTGVR